MEQQEEKRYDPQDTTLKLVTRKDEINLDDDPSILRAEMSCGHVVSPESLTKWCCSQLDMGQYKFTCPALIDEKMCNAEWPYGEVRRLALLTQEEQSHFEETMAVLIAAKHCEHKTCPCCQSFVERADITNLCVLCTICTAEIGKPFHFCWQCMKGWKGPGPRSDRCDNPGCANPDLEKLKKCHNITLPEVENVSCPSLRACPTCGNLVEHNTSGCKNIKCNRCTIEFCFVCLKVTKTCLKTSKHFTLCSDGVAPRQTSIPSWKKNCHYLESQTKTMASAGSRRAILGFLKDLLRCT